MTVASGEINLQSKPNLICHVAKVKPATSAHSMADVISFLVYLTTNDVAPASKGTLNCLPQQIFNFPSNL